MENINKEELLRGIESVQIREINHKVNTSKEVILNNLLGFNLANRAADNCSLTNLFKRYFKGLISYEMVKDDLDVIFDGIEKERIFRKLSFSRKQVKNGRFFNCGLDLRTSTDYFYHRLNDQEIIIGASSNERGIWFHFTNDKVDVNNGIIYTRNKAYEKLKMMCTFEVNPFAMRDTIVTNQETGEQENKKILTFNPGWLNNTIENMDKTIFAIK